MSDQIQPTTELEETDVIMIGAGPSALAAAVYTTREDIKTILLEKGVVGGLAAITDQVDNYPGFPDGITGLDLAEKLEKQAERFGADIRYGEVSQITTNSDDHTVLVKTIDDILDSKREREVVKNQYWIRDNHCLIHRHTAMLNMVSSHKQFEF